MYNKKVVIGGESVYSPLILFAKNNLNTKMLSGWNSDYKHLLLTSGGIHSLNLILHDIEFKNNEYCLIPSYICPTIVRLFKAVGINYRYYKINSKLQPDLKHIDENLNSGCRGLLLINYFGFTFSDEVTEYVKALMKRGIAVIQDLVQATFSSIEKCGNYSFNSFRKFVPADGSLLLSDHEITIKDGRQNNKYAFLKHSGRLLRLLSIRLGLDFSPLFLPLFASSEKVYYDYDKNRITNYDKWLLKKFDYDQIIRERKTNYLMLLEAFHKIALLPELPEKTVPLGFPVLLENRDEIKSRLAQLNIFCPVHWKLHKEIDDPGFVESISLSEKILTLPINEFVNSYTQHQYLTLLRKVI